MTDQDDREPTPLPAEPMAPPVAPVPSPQDLAFAALVASRHALRPFIGASLWCFGALFWSYLVVGEIVVWTAVPEALGVIAVLVTFGVTWYRATSQLPQLPRSRWLMPGITAFFVWLVTLAMSSAVFSTGGRKQAELTALLLWSFAAATYALGRYMTAQDYVQLSPNARAGRIALWLIAGIATLMAGVNIVSYA